MEGEVNCHKGGVYVIQRELNRLEQSREVLHAGIDKAQAEVKQMRDQLASVESAQQELKVTLTVLEGKG